MSEDLSVAMFFYAAVAGILLALGAIMYGDNYQYLSSHPKSNGAHTARQGARLFLAAPVWPLAAIVAIVWGLIVWVPRIVKDALRHD